LDTVLLEAAATLADRARSGELALFFGAGVSIPAGLPSWRELLRACLQACPDLDTVDFHSLQPLDQGELLRRVLGDRFGPIVAQRSTADRHALGHALLAALGCTEAATTNYDQCFELAAAGAGTAPRVMPWEIPHGRAPWLLKLNGDVGHPQSIVLARRDFLRHEALARPSASVLESMMMTRHLLIVGASLTDDNVLRLTHEVAGFRAEHGSEQQPFGTVLDVEAAVPTASASAAQSNSPPDTPQPAGVSTGPPGHQSRPETAPRAPPSRPAAPAHGQHRGAAAAAGRRAGDAVRRLTGLLI
jgi:hypothetical protein